MKDWLELYKIKKLQEGNVIPEVTVYSKQKYIDETKKQQAKYLADMAKYKKDSIQWVNANKAYNDSLNVYNGAINNWENKISKLKKVDDVELKKQINSEFLTNEEKEASKAYFNKGRDRYVNYNDKVNINRNDYNIPPASMLHSTEYGYNTLNTSGSTINKNNYPYSIDDYTASILKDNSKVQPIGLSSTSEGGSHGIFKKPTKAAMPTKPIKSTTAKNVNYDDTYKNLNMRSLWATVAKQDSTQNIGTLHPLDPGYKKGFTINEAAKFPKEIKNKYNIDHILKQINGLNK